jgi:hypothetical protein
LSVDAIFVIKSETILHFNGKIGVRRGTRYNAREKTGIPIPLFKLPELIFSYFVRLFFKENSTDLPVLPGDLHDRTLEQCMQYGYVPFGTNGLTTHGASS